MAHKILQANINHSAAAQDLLIQTMAEWAIQVAVVSEPYYVPSRDNWVGDESGTAAIVTSISVGTPPPVPIKRGPGYVAVRWREIILVGIYFSPNRPLCEFEAFLDDLGAFVRQLPSCPVVVAGDFNAKSPAWGSPATDVRGRALLDWVLTMGLAVANSGREYTCVRQHGGSIVDLTLASPAAARRLQGWRVMADSESLSDHHYIRFDIILSATTASLGGATSLLRRWAVKLLDEKVLLEALTVESWTPSPSEPVDITEEAGWFRGAMTRVCDAAMPRVRPRPPRRRVYWWSRSIARIRTLCVAARRRYTRYRRRHTNRDPAVEAHIYADYREAKKTLKISIRQAKTRARNELLETLNRDPWGRPYRMVLSSVRPWAPPATLSLEPLLLDRIMAALFPQRGEFSPPFATTDANLPAWATEEIPPVTATELSGAVKRLQAKRTAPGPDGVPGRAWVLAMSALGDRLRQLFNECLKTGLFPPQWKVGRLVLLRKEGRPVDSPSAYRPIVLLDEAGKLLERIIVGRLTRHLTETGPNLSLMQFGFRESRSTVDAILRVKALSEEVVSQGGVLLAVSLDIANAFNTLPWECIKEAMRYHGVPPYLYRLVSSYLEGRQVACIGRDSRTHCREISCGVPQGSVLGPLLWNIGYDWVLRGALLPGASLTCYADDTLVMAKGKNIRDAARLATASAAQTVQRIRRLGLEVAIAKTVAVCFHGPRGAQPPGTYMVISGVRIEVAPEIKYLGLILDSRWRFDSHFSQLAPRVMRCASALSGLLPNLGGAGNTCRTLYMGVVRAMALYGAPVWCEALTTGSAAILRKLHRLMSIRAIRGYRTVSYEAACLLAGSLPWHLTAGIYAELFAWCTQMTARGFRIAPREKEAKRLRLRQDAMQEWANDLASPSAGTNIIEAIRPVFPEWINRSHGALTFRLVQLLTGHGCFGRYLHQIARKEPSPRCHHCVDCEEDTAQHTIEECSAWVADRRDLIEVVGDNLSLPAIVKAMVGGKEAWSAVTRFAESVMKEKEEAERQRERATDAPIIRRVRTGRNLRRAGGQFHQRPP